METLTTYVSDPNFSQPDEVDHGFEVYRVARLVLSDANLLLYKAAKGRTILESIYYAANKGAVIVNISQAIPSSIEIVNRKHSFTDSFASLLSKLISKKEIFVFFAIGNERSTTHSWISSDSNQNGYVDFFEPEKHPDVDRFPIQLHAPQSEIYFTWDSKRFPLAAYRVELYDDHGEKLSESGPDPNDSRKGFIALHYSPSEDEKPAMIRIKRLAGPSSGVFMRLAAYK